MANFPIPEDPRWLNEIRKFETTDPAHADLFNAVVARIVENLEYLYQNRGGGGIKVIPKGEDIPLPQRQEGYLYLKVLDSVEIELNNQIRVSSNMGVEVPEKTDVSGMKIAPFMGLRIYEE